MALQPPRLLDQVRQRIRLRDYSIRTEKAGTARGQMTDQASLAASPWQATDDGRQRTDDRDQASRRTAHNWRFLPRKFTDRHGKDGGSDGRRQNTAVRGQ